MAPGATGTLNQRAVNRYSEAENEEQIDPNRPRIIDDREDDVEPGEIRDPDLAGFRKYKSL